MCELARINWEGLMTKKIIKVLQNFTLIKMIFHIIFIESTESFARVIF